MQRHRSKTFRIRRLAGLAAAGAIAIALNVAAQQSPTRPGARPAPKLDEKAREATTQEKPGPAPGTGGGPVAPGQPQTSPEVTVTEGKAPAVGARVVTPEGRFEPVLLRPVDYGSLPEVDASVLMSLTGPMAAKEFLDALAISTGWNIATTPAVSTIELQFWTNKISPAQALAILRFRRLLRIRRGRRLPVRLDERRAPSAPLRRRRRDGVCCPQYRPAKRGDRADRATVGQGPPDRRSRFVQTDRSRHAG
jgi:hypothetical protein